MAPGMTEAEVMAAVEVTVAEVVEAAAMEVAAAQDAVVEVAAAAGAAETDGAMTCDSAPVRTWGRVFHLPSSAAVSRAWTAGGALLRGQGSA